MEELILTGRRPPDPQTTADHLWWDMILTAQLSWSTSAMQMTPGGVGELIRPAHLTSPPVPALLSGLRSSHATQETRFEDDSE